MFCFSCYEGTHMLILCFKVHEYVIDVIAIFIAGQVGCADGTQEGLGGHARLAACAGTWEGHVHNASTLCAPGWRVCSWYDHTLLRTITWKNATSFPGCFAYNAAQDGGRCRECRDDLEHVSRREREGTLVNFAISVLFFFFVCFFDPN